MPALAGCPEVEQSLHPPALDSTLLPGTAIADACALPPPSPTSQDATSTTTSLQHTLCASIKFQDPSSNQLHPFLLLGSPYCLAKALHYVWACQY